jgi:hypothetical protein
MGNLPLGVTGYLVAACLLFQGCANATPVCEQRSDLGTVGSTGAPILAAEVDELLARVRVAGGRTTRKRALNDLLWQESERQRLGLEGGINAPASRRATIVAYRTSIKKGPKSAPPLVMTRPPPGAKLSKCGEALMKEAN